MIAVAPTYLSLFSGIGGLDLGLDRAGFRCAGQVERDPLRRSVLARHWPEVPRHDDVRTAPAWWRAGIRPAVRLVAGGFPCQPFSRSGRQRGVGDERWGWPWFCAVVRKVRPEYVLVENVAALLDDTDAFSWILGDLAALGFDAEWSVLSACALGAPHPRERLFLVAYADQVDGREGLGAGQEQRLAGVARGIGEGVVSGAAARAWRDRVGGALETSRSDDREVDGSARWLVAAGGDAVVADVGEYVGRLIMAHLLADVPKEVTQ